MKRDGDAEVMGHRRASQAGIWIKREEFCAGFVMGDKGGSVTKKNAKQGQNARDVTHGGSETDCPERRGRYPLYSGLKLQ